MVLTKSCQRRQFDELRSKDAGGLGADWSGRRQVLATTLCWTERAGVKHMIVSDVSDIHAVLAPHLRLLRDHDPLISMLHAASPPDSGDDEVEEDDHFTAGGGDRWG